MTTHREALEKAREDIEAAAAVFRLYETLHTSKGTADGTAKAAKNKLFAQMLECRIEAIDAALAAQPEGPTPAVPQFRRTGWAAERDHYAVPVLFNPYSGEPRDARDIQTDPQGILMRPPGAHLFAAPKPPAPQPSAALAEDDEPSPVDDAIKAAIASHAGEPQRSAALAERQGVPSDARESLLLRLREAADDYTIEWGTGELYDMAADEIERLLAVSPLPEAQPAEPAKGQP